jgi:predicted alpha/beta-fold hydrolase
MTCLQTLFVAVLVLAVGYYFVTAAQKPKLVYQKNPLNDFLVAHTPALINRYFPTPWLFNTHVQLIVLGCIKAFAKALDYDRQDVLTMPDGGTVSVDWLGLNLPEDRPTMVVLHTITGSPQSMRGFVRYIHEKLGWRVALCVRRGHGTLDFTAPSYNTLGNADDFAQQLQHIQSCFPQSDLYATGISAGSGALAQYLGRVGNDTPLKAAMAYCPAYDMRNAFSRAKPFYSKMMAKKLKKAFVYPNEATFGHLESYAAMKQCEDLHDYHQHLYGMAGNISTEDYMQNSNPAVVFDNITIPILILNAADDPVCHIDNVYKHLHRMEKMPNVILAITKRGSHCAYFEGWLAKPWANRLAAEYFSAHHKNSV